jgi:acetylornithine deacetylase/succinyl-diaminopimelate desuccinylase-like protein
MLNAYFATNRDRLFAELQEWLRIPSISALPAHHADVRAAAEWLCARLRKAGIANARLVETPGNPVVYGEWLQAPGAPTYLIYGHYDVQPVDPLDKWQSPPFTPTVRDGRVYARGASDDKGPLFQAVAAVESLLALHGRLPVNLKFLLEGEEECGSPNLRPFVESHKELLACDLAISADGAMWRASEPSLTIAGKGLCGLEVHLTTARTDLHSGRYGGAVPNALHAMAELVAGLHAPDGRIAVAGFYDDVTPLSPEDRVQFAALPFDEEAFREELGLPALFGEAGYSTLERNWARPTLDVNGMWGGFQGEGGKTVIPCEAHAKLTCRLVPNQRPERILDLIEAHIRARTPVGARVTVTREAGNALPYGMPADLPELKVAARVLEAVMGKPALYVRMGATIPVAETFQTNLGAYTLFYSFSAVDEQYHAPNEFFRLERFDAGLTAWAMLLEQLGAEH